MRQTPEPPEADPAGTDEPIAADRPTALRLARLHLRTGSLALARVELETLAGEGALDDEALLDLAEVRWRTDDLTGAGEAAAAHIASGREAPIALIIAAEATAALGRPGEARRLAARAIELVDRPIDAVFAGMPRSDVWPVQPLERVAGWTLPPIEVTIVADERARDDGAREPDEPAPDPGADLEAARAALAAGDRSAAAFRLSVVLRLSPALAPAVLDVAGTEPGPDFDLVRGDALRLVGREVQARQAFSSAAAGRRAMDQLAARSAPEPRASAHGESPPSAGDSADPSADEPDRI
ncbi:MAG: hypothetical protein M3P84_10735 [Chloroflexota bacterium]|nr:hypothetical protein [Chloroflexota bacterium]